MHSQGLRPMLLLLLLAFLPGSVAGDGGLPPGPVTRGVQITREVPFASETLDAVRAAHATRPEGHREGRAIHSHRIIRQPGAGANGAPELTPLAITSVFPADTAASVPPRAPRLDNGFAGLENPPHGQRDVIPPDTMGAVGPNHLVSLLNSDFGVFDKTTGTLQQKVDLQSFWASLGTGPGEPADFPFDTKVLFDQFSGRFAALTLGGGSAGNSWIMIAVSAGSDPTGTWNKWAIPSSPDNTVWADFPGFGLDGSNLYVTANMFNDTGYRYSKAWVIPKAQLLSGANPITRFEFANPAGSGPSMQPAHTFDLSVPEYIVYEWASGSLRVARIDTVAGTPVWGSPINVPVTFFEAFALLPDAPQAGDSRGINTSDTRLLNAVYRNSFLWTTHTVGRNGKTEVSWYRINPASGTVPAQGRIGDTSRWYYYPSIGVNRNGDAAIGASGSSTSEYVGGYYTLIRSGSSAGEPVSLLKSGEASYYKTFSGTDNRWGDFSATVVDPSDDVTFWTLQEYAMTPDPVTLASRWGTWWGKFRPSNVSAPSSLTATASPLPQVALAWAADSVNQTGFLVERRRLPGQDYVSIASLPPNLTAFTDNSSTGLIGGFTYSYRVQAYNSTGGSYSNEAFASTVAPPPPASGGGGGGCLAMAPSSGARAGVSSILHVALLFLPAAVYGWRRLLLPRKR